MAKRSVNTNKYKLKPHCYAVYGAKAAIIYDATEERVYPLDREAADVIKGKRLGIGVWKKLEKLGIAAQIQNNRKGMKDLFQLCPIGKRKKAKLRFMWLEITKKCNLKCQHCYGSFGGNAGGVSMLSINDWRRILKEGSELDCPHIQFVGGEPLMCSDLPKMIEFSAELGFKSVTVFTNCTLLTPRLIRLLKTHKIKVSTSLYSCEAGIHDQVTQTPGSFEQTMKALKQLRKEDIPTKIVTIAMKTNEHTLEDTKKLIKKMGFGNRNPHAIHPTGRGSAPGLLPSREAVCKYSTITEPTVEIRRDQFQRAHYWNTCWAGKICVCCDGNVLPCIFARQHIVGNVKGSTLREVIEGKELHRLWGITKDEVDRCRDCEYRYTCKDCRPLAESMGGSLLSASPRCAYNPYTGRWEDAKINRVTG